MVTLPGPDGHPKFLFLEESCRGQEFFKNRALFCGRNISKNEIFTFQNDARGVL